MAKVHAEYFQCWSDAVASAPSGERPPAGTGDVKTVQLGDLIVAAFDEAARWSTSPAEVSRLATRVITHMLRHAGKTVQFSTNQTARARRRCLTNIRPLHDCVLAKRIEEKDETAVLMGKYAGSKVKLDGKNHIILLEDYILGITEK